MPNSKKNDAKKCQTTELKFFLQPTSFKDAKFDLFGVLKCQLATVSMHRCNAPVKKNSAPYRRSEHRTM